MLCNNDCLAELGIKTVDYSNQADQNVLVLSIKVGAFLLFMFLLQKHPPEDQETRQVN